jgi:branched-chain amino acid transport system permease protein
MFYREAGQFKTNYVADQAVFPIRQDRIGIAAILLDRLRGDPALWRRFPAASGDDSVPDLSLAAIGLNLLTGYTGLLSLGTGAFMGVGAYACYKLTTVFPRREHHRLDRLSGFVCGGDRRGVRPAVAAHQGLLSGDCDARRAVLPAMVLRPHPLARELQRLERDRGAAAHARRHRVTGPNSTPLTRYFVVLTIVVLMTWIASNIVHGRIGRMWMAIRDRTSRRNSWASGFCAPSCWPSPCRPSIAALPAR